MVGSTPAIPTGKYPARKEIMSNRDKLKVLSGLIASGKDGYINAIDEFSKEYKADPSILPTEFGDLSAKQTVVHFGAYLVAHKGFNAHQVYGYANVLSAKSDKIDLTADKSVISSLLSSLEIQIEKDNLSTANSNMALGKTQENIAKGIVADVQALTAVVGAPTLNKSWMLYVSQAVKELQALLPVVEDAKVEESVAV